VPPSSKTCSEVNTQSTTTTRKKKVTKYLPRLLTHFSNFVVRRGGHSAAEEEEGADSAAAAARRPFKPVACSIVETFGEDVTPRDLEETLRLEYRTKLLNPRWGCAGVALKSDSCRVSRATLV